MSNYSTKKYYWLKLFDEFFNEARIKKLKRMAGGDTYIVILLKLMLKTIKNNGVYEYQGIEATIAKELELELDEKEEHIQVVLIYLEKTGLIELIEPNCYLLTQVPTMLGTESDSAERKRKQRAREKTKNVTLSHASHIQVTNCHTEIEIEIEKEIEIEPYSRGQGSDLKPKVKLNLSTKVAEFRQRLINSGYAGHLAMVNVEGVDEHVYINEHGRLYTPTRTDKQIVSSTLDEIWEQLSEINESRSYKTTPDPLKNLKINKIGA